MINNSFIDQCEGIRVLVTDAEILSQFQMTFLFGKSLKVEVKIGQAVKNLFLVRLSDPKNPLNFLNNYKNFPCGSVDPH